MHSLLLTLPAIALGYTEIVATRNPFVGATGKQPQNWQRFPSTEATKVVALDSARAVVLGRSSSDQVSLFVASEQTKAWLSNVTLKPSLPWDASTLLVAHAGALEAIVHRGCTYRTVCDFGGPGQPNCALDRGVPKAACAARAPAASAPPPFGAALASAISNNDSLWLATDSGLFRLALPWAADATPALVLPHGMAAVAATDDEVVAANDEKIWSLDPHTALVTHWEWVTQPAEGWGGVVDDNVTSLDFGGSIGAEEEVEVDALPVDAQGRGGRAPGPALFVGNRRSLSVRSSDGAYTRIGPDQGLPYGNITSLRVGAYQGAALLWVGTAKGVALWTNAAGSAQAQASPSWRYFFGPRWLAGDAVRSLAVVGSSAVVVTDGGVSWLSHEEWTLARKAAVYEEILTKRHDRHGMTAECAIASYGDPAAGCVSHDSDNNGLWTSLVVAAEYMRHAVTGEAEALATGSRFFGGIELLNEVTGKRGLVARSACDPEEKNKTCAGAGTWIHDKTLWRNSTSSKYTGWIWKSDASSDETTGHVFALSAVARLSPVAAERARATQLLVDLVGGICQNGFQLIDVTGHSTTWGKWDPASVNGLRAFSDERGLQSLQILAYIAAALNATGPAKHPLWAAAYTELTNATNRYDTNLLNLKITYPEDDNYSDDELAYHAYYSLLAACPAASACASIIDRAPALASFSRSQRIVRPERAALYNAMYHGLVPNASGRAEALADLVWNLQTWPLELIEWPTNNSHRLDIVYEQHMATRFNKVHTHSIHTRSPLPANERRQDRWNGAPWDVSDGWDGMTEGDPGAWLLPYWMGRYHGLISATD